MRSTPLLGALALIALLATGACSKPTALASEANAKGRITAAAAPAQTAPPEVPEEFLIDEQPPEVAPDPSAPSISDAFPDYQPLGRGATVTDYRPSVTSEVAGLPPVSDAPALARAFADWRNRAAGSPGAMEEGAIQLGADPQQYRPSDAELVAAEAGDRLAAALNGADDMTKASVSEIVGGAAGYKRFDYRNVDVMGSGRFFYASPPKDASLPL